MMIFAWAGSTSAQDGVAQLRNPARSSYDVVALRVEFQPDTSRYTTGTGTFDGSIFDSLTVSIDPLPHDAGYFNAHLTFLEEYVRRVSDGQTVLRTHLIPEVVRLPHRMGHYSPTGPEADSPAEQEKLARLVRDAWSAADRQSDFDMSRFSPENTALLLFHAGAGRDIELVGTSLTNTPEDIPSLYLDRRKLSRLGAGFPTFNGFPVRHSMILPQTESRLGTNPLTQEPYVAEFSLNGMLAATFFNYLGVPDLFNTETGETAIGPFGLMDPLGIFAYSGLFPPEPTAWTKYYLGWIDPPELQLSESTEISLTAAADTSSSDAVLIRISEAEYFLLENRHRDPRHDGLRLRVWKNDEFVTQQIPAGSDDFTRFDPSGFIGGVVAGVDAYDWAVPGGTTEEGDIMYGGMAIWHVDERRVEQGLAGNSINTDPRRRGIDLEEADGAQDLGFAAATMFGSGSEQGTPFDLFFRGNPVRVVTDRGETVRLYENRFGPDTRPGSANSEGGPSLVELFDFSEPGPEMTVSARLTATADIRPVRALRTYGLPPGFGLGSAVTALASASDTTLYFVPGGQSQDSIYTVDLSSAGPPEVLPWQRTGGFKPVRYGSHMVALTSDPDNGRWTLQVGDSTTVDLPLTSGRPVGAPVVVESERGPVLYAAFRSADGSSLIRWAAGTEARRVTDALPSDILALAGAGDGRLAVVGRRETVVRGGTSRWTYELPTADGLVGAAFGRDRNGLVGVLTDTTARELLVLQSDGTTNRIGRERLGAAGSVHPVVSDLDRDGILDILVAAGTDLKAFSQEGAVVEGFPVRLAAPAVSQPLVVRFREGEAWTVLVGGTNGYLHGYQIGSVQRPDPRFPLAVGRSVRATPLFGGGMLAAVTHSGEIEAWQFADVDSVAWGQLHADVWNRSYVEVTGAGESLPGEHSGEGLISGERTYNWPNPVRDGRTHLRMLVRRHCDVRITIVDMAGTLIEEISVDSVPPNIPYETTWETDVPSGVYYARLKATAGDGTTDTELITIAVVK